MLSNLYLYKNSSLKDSPTTSRVWLLLKSRRGGVSGFNKLKICVTSFVNDPITRVGNHYWKTFNKFCLQTFNLNLTVFAVLLVQIFAYGCLLFAAALNKNSTRNGLYFLGFSTRYKFALDYLLLNFNDTNYCSEQFKFRLQRYFNIVNV